MCVSSRGRLTNAEEYQLLQGYQVLARQHDDLVRESLRSAAESMKRFREAKRSRPRWSRRGTIPNLERRGWRWCSPTLLGRSVARGYPDLRKPGLLGRVSITLQNNPNSTSPRASEMYCNRGPRVALWDERDIHRATIAFAHVRDRARRGQE
jgi:hypothetical protein